MKKSELRQLIREEISNELKRELQKVSPKEKQKLLKMIDSIMDSDDADIQMMVQDAKKNWPHLPTAWRIQVLDQVGVKDPDKRNRALKDMTVLPKDVQFRLVHALGMSGEVSSRDIKDYYSNLKKYK